jgi:hypothetical protein
MSRIVSTASASSFRRPSGPNPGVGKKSKIYSLDFKSEVVQERKRPGTQQSVDRNAANREVLT